MYAKYMASGMILLPYLKITFYANSGNSINRRWYFNVCF